MSWLPLDRSGDGLNVHLPSGPMVVEPIVLLPSYTVIVSPATPVPLMFGCASFVGFDSGWPWSSVMPLITGLGGTTGALAGMITDIGVDAEP